MTDDNRGAKTPSDDDLREIVCCLAREERSPLRSVGWGWLDGDEDFKRRMALHILIDEAFLELFGDHQREQEAERKGPAK